MFYLKTENRSDGRTWEKTPEKSDIRVIAGAGIRVTAITDGLYAFYLHRGPNVFIGESLWPTSDDELIKVTEHLQAGGDYRIPDGNVLTIAIMNTQDGDIKVYKSQSCNRPAYFYIDDGKFICTSHLQLINDDGVRLELDQEIMPEFFAYRFIMPPKTLFKNIRYLPGGWSLSGNAVAGEVNLQNNWKLKLNDRVTDIGEIVDSTTQLLRRSMEPIKAMGEKAVLLLSGGLDSSILGAFSKESGIDVDSISSGFHLITGDSGESEYARSAAEVFGFNHSVHDVSEEDYLSALIDSINITGEPIHHLQSAALGLLFSNGIKPGVKYLINGEGADSLFCNTMHYQYWINRSIVRFTDNPFIRVLLKPLLSLPSPIRDRFRYYSYNHSDDHSDMQHFIWGLGAYGDIEWVKDRYGVNLARIVENRRRFLDNYMGWPILDKITILSFCGEADETMKIWGKLAEHHGKIMIYPFSFPALISFAFGVTWEIKAREPKYLLKNVARSVHIPEEIINRRKKSFGFPIAYWALPGTLFQPLVEMAGEMFEPAELQSLQTMELPKAMILWGMLNLYIWQKMFVDDIEPAEIKREVLERHRSQKKKSV